MKSVVLCWLCLLGVSVPLLVLYEYVIKRFHSASPEAPRELRGYIRINPERKEQFLDVHCSHCSLVSSSGHMLGTGVGEEIDQDGCVIRMNNAPTLGYEKDVGSRTSLRVVSHTSVPKLLKNERYFFQQSAKTTYVFWGPDKKMRQDGKGQTFNALLKMASKYPDARIYMLTSEKMQDCDQVFQDETGKNRMTSGAFLSTGFFTMILALDMCDSIRVYGMINKDYCSSANHSAVPYHYYEPRTNECSMYRANEHRKRGGHRFITEKAIYAKWATLHKMEFKHPSWSP